jgi:hypothetical protein
MERARFRHHPEETMSQPTTATGRTQTANDALRRTGVDYGLDAPGIVMGFAALAISLLVIGMALGLLASSRSLHRLGSMASWMGISFALTCLLMI